MKVYAVMSGRNYEGDTLDSLWASFELAKARVMEILAEEDSYCNTADGVPYEPISEAPGSCFWQFKRGSGGVVVSEMVVGT